jgi:putative SOS response-associated peptidase YedK
MPVLLDPPTSELWLGGARGTELLRLSADNKLRMWPVSRRVNNTAAVTMIRR